MANSCAWLISATQEIGNIQLQIKLNLELCLAYEFWEFKNIQLKLNNEDLKIITHSWTLNLNYLIYCKINNLINTCINNCQASEHSEHVPCNLTWNSSSWHRQLKTLQYCQFPHGTNGINSETLFYYIRRVKWLHKIVQYSENICLKLVSMTFWF